MLGNPILRRVTMASDTHPPASPPSLPPSLQYPRWGRELVSPWGTKVGLQIENFTRCFLISLPVEVKNKGSRKQAKRYKKDKFR